MHIKESKKIANISDDEIVTIKVIYDPETKERKFLITSTWNYAIMSKTFSIGDLDFIA